MSVSTLDAVADGWHRYIRRLALPRARWIPAGTGYWVVRLVRNGIVYQGVGPTLAEAYGAWVNLMEQHR